MPFIQTAATLAATGVGVYSAVKQGEQTERAAHVDAIQQINAAKEERAIAHLEIARKSRADRALLSEQRTLMANSGFTTDDPTSAHLLTETVGAQTLEKLLVKAQAESGAAQMEFAASNMRRAGANAAADGRTQGAIALLNAAPSWRDRYGPPTRASTVPPVQKKLSNPSVRAG
ncbi:hypothetical protein U91I_02761 [alpha proteobacterium U9-1i]|nr:hypothetical protein U91I_02761 [alpha proteobacterium U9-1i]